jgi:hypothetical protein
MRAGLYRVLLLYMLPESIIERLSKSYSIEYVSDSWSDACDDLEAEINPKP